MSLWRNRDFSLLLGVQTLSTLGDAFSSVALPLLVLHLTGSVAQMGLLTGLSGAAMVITGLVAGVIVDRLDRRLILVLCDVGRAVVYGSVPLILLLTDQIWPIFVIVPLGSALGMIFNVAYVAALPAIVAPDQITQANGYLYASYTAGGVIGPALAGLVSGAYGPGAAIGFDALTFGISAAGLLFIRLRPTTAGDSDKGFLVGAKFLWRNRVLRALTILLTAFIFLTAGLDDMVVFHLKTDLGQPDAVVGYVMGAGAIGSVIGSLIVAAVQRRLGFGPSWLAAIVLTAFATAALALGGGPPAVGAVMLVFMLATSIAGISSLSLRQRITPPHLLGRVTAAFWTIHFALGPLGAALATVSAAAGGVTPVFLAIGGGCLLIALIGSCTPVRTRNPQPEEPA